MNPTRRSVLAQSLHGFFTDYLPGQRAMSRHTLHSYRDSLKLFLRFIAGKKGDPSALAIEQLTTEQTLAFLDHLEANRKNKVCTRNIRLSAIHSFFRYVGGQHPEHLDQAQRVLSVPFKRAEMREVQHLEFAEIQAVLNTINRATPDGRRDFVLLTLLFNTGARVSEIVGLKAVDLQLTVPASVSLRGKGRNYAKVAVMRRWHFGDRVERTLSLHLAGGWGRRKAGEICEKPGFCRFRLDQATVQDRLSSAAHGRQLPWHNPQWLRIGSACTWVHP